MELAIRLDDDQSVKSDVAAGIGAHGNADTPSLRTAALGLRDALFPLELFGAAVERFLDEGTGCVRQFAASSRRSERRFAFRSVDAAQGDLIDIEFPCGFRKRGFHDRDPLHASRSAL